MNTQLMNKAAAKLEEAKEELQAAVQAASLGDAYEQKRWEASRHAIKAIKLLAQVDAFAEAARMPD